MTPTCPHLLPTEETPCSCWPGPGGQLGADCQGAAGPFCQPGHHRPHGPPAPRHRRGAAYHDISGCWTSTAWCAAPAAWRHAGWRAHPVAPLCSPNGHLGNLKPQGKEGPRSPAPGPTCGGKEPKDLKARRKKSQDGKGCLLDSGVWSPVDSPRVPHGYLSDVASPAPPALPFQPSPPCPSTTCLGCPRPTWVSAT